MKRLIILIELVTPKIVNLTLFGMGEGGKTRFSPVTSTTVGFSPKNFLTSSFNPFTTMV